MRKIVITEEELYSIIENVITELNKDINEPLWNVYRIPSKIGANGYSISSSLNENNLLNKQKSFKELSKETKSLITKEFYGDHINKYPAELVGFLFLDRENEPQICSFISEVTERIDLKDLLKKRDLRCPDNLSWI